MEKYEYMFFETEIGDYKGTDCTKGAIQELNKLGKEGWKAVGLSAQKIVSYTRPVTILLMRTIQ